MKGLTKKVYHCNFEYQIGVREVARIVVNIVSQIQLWLLFNRNMQCRMIGDYKSVLNFAAYSKKRGIRGFWLSSR